MSGKTYLIGGSRLRLSGTVRTVMVRAIGGTAASLWREYGLRPGGARPALLPRRGEVMLSGLKILAWRLTLVTTLVLALAAAEARAQWGLPSPQAQAAPPAPVPSTSRGENFSAKPPAQLFASDCTGAGCHKGPQGLSGGRGQGSLAGFLREHYTNSRESAAALAAYLVSVPGDARAAKPDPRQPRTATRSDETAKPADDAARTRKPPAGETGEPAKPAPATRQQRGRQATAPPPSPPPAAPATTPAPAEAPAAPPPPQRPQWDIFD